MPDDVCIDISLRSRLEGALAAAQNEDRDSIDSATLRLVLCALDDRDVSARERGECRGCPEQALQDLLTTMAAQRERSAAEYDEAGRIEEAERERAELAVIKSFLPQKLEGAELEHAVKNIVEELEATRLKDIGRCMQALKLAYPCRVETGLASKAVRAALA